MIVPLGKLLLGSGSFGSSGTTGGAGELYGADYGFLGSNHFEAFEVEVANLDGLAQAEGVDVDYEAFGNCGVGSAHFDFLHRECELTTGLNTFGVAFKLNGHRNNHGLLGGNFEEVDMEDVIFYGVELNFAEHCVGLVAVYIEVDGENLGSVDELAHSFVGEGEVGGDDAAAVLDFNELLSGFESALERKFYGLAAIEHSRNQTFFAESFGSFLAKLNTGSGFQIKCLHFA